MAIFLDFIPGVFWRLEYPSPMVPSFFFWERVYCFYDGNRLFKKSVGSRRYFGLVSYGSNWNVLSGTQREIL